MSNVKLILTFFICVFKPSYLEKVSNQEVQKNKLYFVYFFTTVALTLLVRILSLYLSGHELSIFHSYIHLSVFLLRNTLVIVLVDFCFLFGLHFVAGDKNGDLNNDSFALKLVVFTNFPIVLGSLVMSGVSFLPIYFMTVVWKFFIIRKQILLRETSKRQANVNAILLFCYYALLYYFVSWIISGILIWSRKVL